MKLVGWKKILTLNEIVNHSSWLIAFIPSLVIMILIYKMIYELLLRTKRVTQGQSAQSLPLPPTFYHPQTMTHKAMTKQHLSTFPGALA